MLNLFIHRSRYPSVGAFVSILNDSQPGLAQASGPVYLVWPILPYNVAGWSVAAAARRFGVSAARVTVVHDDLDTVVGELRWKHGGSAGGNKGVRSVAASLQTDAFRRLRVGIGRPPAREHQNRGKIAAWVLGTLPHDDWEQISARWAADALQATLLQPPEPVGVVNGDVAEAP